MRSVARTLTEPPTFPLTRPVLERMKGLCGAELLLVERTGGRISTFLTPPLPPNAPTADAPSLGPPVRIADAEYRCLRFALVAPHPNEGGQLYLFYPEAALRSAVRDSVRPLLLLGGGSGLVAMLLSALTSSRLARRIREVARRTGDVAGGTFQPLPLPTNDDELRDLCQSVNAMAHQLAEAQDALQRAERLRVLGQFAGGLAHQLRNAAGGAKLAIELYLGGEPVGDIEPLTVALRQLTRIESNLRQFLDYGKAPETRRDPCDLVRLISQAVALLRPQSEHAGTTLVWQPPAPSVPFVGDATQLGHLFGNLIGNALDAAGAEGTVEVCLTLADTLCVDVIDTGAGPPDALAAKLFEPFVSGKDQGIGLGLAVARQAAGNHGGTVAWFRTANKTLFRVLLPAR